MTGCTLCPRNCGKERTATARGTCGAAALPRVHPQLHFFEEPPISGTRGSGTVFFYGCNLACVFCQNHRISAGGAGTSTPDVLAGVFLELAASGAHNINLVTPAPHAAALREAIPLARAKGLHLPIVYNTNAYERVETLRALEGLIDVYLPDLKYVSAELSGRFSGAPDYFAFAAPAISEMFRQVGPLITEGGIARSGLLIRHLALPGCLFDTRAALEWIARNLPRDTALSLMRQYTPMHRAGLFPPLNRPLTAREYERALDACLRLGLTNVFIQDEGAVSDAFTPRF